MEKQQNRLPQEENHNNGDKSVSEVTGPILETETDLLGSMSTLKNSFLKREKGRNPLDLLE